MTRGKRNVIACLCILAVMATGCGKRWLGLGWPVPGDTTVEEVPGLRGDVAIRWDYLYIPHVKADEDRDAFFGLGYAMASTRLFQMDLFRHMAKGEMAKMTKLHVKVKQVGKKEKIDLRDVDAFLRLMDFAGIGERLVDGLSDERRELVQAFADGINAFATKHEKELSAPYSLPLGIGRPFEEWKVTDSAAILAMMAFVLSKNLDEESAAIMALSEGTSLDKLLTLLSPDVVQDTDEFEYLRKLAPKLAGIEFIDGFPMWESFIQGELHISPDSSGSNNWVVGGERSASGKPVFANDPHLGRMMPGYWWLGHVRSPGFNAAGGFIPGVPMLVIGHNEKAVWGATMVKGDNTDLAIETIDPENLTYLRGTEWRPMGDNSFAVPGKKRRFPMEFHTTEFGPIISKITPDSSAAVAMRWAAWFSNTSFEAGFDLMTARSVYEIEAAAKRIGLVTINLVCADTKGNIGWFVTGDYPRRKGFTGFLPMDGADLNQGWDGLLEFHERAGGINSPKGYYVTANNRPVDSPYADVVSSSYASPHRFTRISSLIENETRMSVDKFRVMQADTVSDQVQKVMPYILAAVEGDRELETFVEVLRQWNGSMTAGSHPALIYQVFVSNFVRIVISDLSPATQEAYLASVQFNQQPVEALPLDSCGLWPNAERRNEIVRQALVGAKQELETKFPKDWPSKTWGDVHRLWLKNPLVSVPFIGRKYKMDTVPYPGDSQTINAGGFRPGRTYDAQYYSSLRLLIDMAEPGKARVSFPGGQSENANHPAYSNMFDAWYEVQDYQLLFDEQDIEDGSLTARWTLEPEN